MEEENGETHLGNSENASRKRRRNASNQQKQSPLPLPSRISASQSRNNSSPLNIDEDLETLYRLSERKSLENDEDSDDGFESSDFEDNSSDDENYTENPSKKSKTGEENQEASERRKAARRELYGPDVDELGTSEYDAEFSLVRSSRKKAKRVAGKPKLTPELSKMMGEANMAYATQDFSTAVTLLQEVIRQAPNASDPYHVLGLIYEEMEDHAKSFEFYMIAAHIDGRDADLWIRLANISRENEKYRQAIYCLTKAIKINPENTDAIWERAILYSDIHDYKRAIEGLQALAKISGQNTKFVSELARLYHKIGEPKKAIELIKDFLGTTSNFDANLLNILVELHMGIGEFEAGVEAVEQLSAKLGGMSQVPLDILVNFAICQAYSGKIEKAEEYFEKLFEQSITNFGDLFFSVAETYMALSLFEKAIPILNRLVEEHPDEYNRAAVWNKLACCFDELNKLEESIYWFGKVFQVSPDTTEAALSLASNYRKNKELDKALTVLEHHIDSVQSFGGTNGEITPVDPRILVEKGFIHYDKNQFQQFLETVLPTIDESLQQLASISPKRDHKKARKRRYVSLLNASKKRAAKASENQNILPPIAQEDQTGNLLFFSTRRGEKFQQPQPEEHQEEHEEEQNQPEEEDKPVPVHLIVIIGEEKYYSLVYKSCKVLAELEYYEMASILISETLQYLDFIDRTKADQLRLLDVGVAINSGRFSSSFDSVRYICTKRPNSPIVWNLFTKLATAAGSFLAHSKFIERLSAKHPESVSLIMLEAHQRSMGETYLSALKGYFKAFKLAPKEPIISLCIGAAYLGIAMSRKIPDRHDAVMKAFTFIYRYFDLMNGNEEAMYNAARAYHQLGLTHLALPYYQKVLNIHENDKTMSNNLVKETAWNLVLIYKESGSFHLAREIMHKYLTI
eukprot:TRINITY_DN8887_c0_g1_i1.p1 TRINITY_DN8887_c0_g1~~TRINITY_DN8887_c0_g1_i1.p1  ORF type:complete len:914 (+),score=326.92 TRINITY_DN8887_c0_g1_i1:57-2798(+)